MHPLQETFATAAGEAEWAEALAARFEAGELAGAEAELRPLVEFLPLASRGIVR